MSFDIASLHLRIWRLHVSFDVEIEDRPQAEPPEPMGFGSSTVVEVPDLEDGGDVEDRRLGFPG